MDKIKINLLPKEVLEKRKTEQRLALMLLGVIGLVAILIAVYGLNFIRVAQEQAKLDTIKAESDRVAAQIRKIADFEQSKLFVEEREKLVNTAIAKKYSWSRLLNNISLIIPNEVWLMEVAVEKDGKMTIKGKGVGGSLASGIGHKPVAKWLVHLAELEDLKDVWLTRSTKAAESESGGGGLGPTSSSSTTDTKSSSTVEFETTAKLKLFDVTNPSAPAPPAPGGKT